MANNQLAEAEAELAKDKHAAKRKTRLIHHLDRGVVAHLRGEYERSNQFFEKAYTTHRNFLDKPIDEALALIINPNFADYRGEDHEVLLLHYYKALNFLQLGQYRTALVECRRLNIKLSLLSRKYNSPHKYQRDAFIHTLTGLVYQANHEYNNAFIAYRNAVEIYQEDYKHLFGLSVPLQLQKDLIYTAYATGLYDQVDRYTKMFGLEYDPAQEPADTGDTIFLWNNGLGPVKDEWALHFVIMPQKGGLVMFYNHELKLGFPFPMPKTKEGKPSILDLKAIRVVFPKYQERPLLYQKAAIFTPDGQQYSFELLEDINAISLQILQQRMMLELSKSLLRVALKQMAQYQLGKQDKVLGAILGGANFVSEKADTRNWQTLPHSIYYTRVRLPVGTHTLRFQAIPQKHGPPQERVFSLEVYKGSTTFQVINAPVAIPERITD